MYKRIGLLIITLLFFTMVACSDEERVNPEDFLTGYLEAWQSFQFEEMKEYMDEASVELLSDQEWVLEERMEKVYEDLGIDEIELNFESRNFEEEEINLDEVEELTYDVDVTMSTIAGEVEYTTEVVLHKKIEGEENEIETWLVEWHPSHIFVGLEKPSDQISIKTELPERGEIYDRNGELLAVNGQVYRAGFIPEKVENFDVATQQFADLFNIDVERVRELANAYPDNPDWEAPILRFPVNDPREAELYNISGVMWSREDGRQYPYGNELAHLIGYIGPITAEELEENAGKGYTASSVIGKRGLESVFEDRLRGEVGITVEIQDENGNTKDVVVSKEPVDGEDITLTIDVSLQKRLTEIIGDDIGTAVVMNPTTGEVLALVSQPSYDSNLRYLNLPEPHEDEFDDINILYERRFQNTYVPGSIFKAITGAIGLEEGVIDPDEKITITGRRWQPEDAEDWGNYHVTRVSERVSEVDFLTAMTYSDNIYFAQQALKTGGDALESWAEKLGFNEEFTFTFPLYASSIANDGFKSDIQLADTGYGQGEVLVNPIHMSALFSMFLNDGDIIQPVLLKEEETGQMWKEDVISEETVETVLESLISVVENERGTAYRSNPGHDRAIAGKTGTAELKLSYEDDNRDELGWYVAMDYEKKDMLVMMMIENPKGGSGYVVDKVNEFLQ